MIRQEFDRPVPARPNLAPARQLGVDIVRDAHLDKRIVLVRAEQLATSYAHANVPIEAVLDAVRKGFAQGADTPSVAVAARATERRDSTVRAISCRYVAALRSREAQVSPDLMAELLGGEGVIRAARQTGLPVAHGYTVLTLAFGPGSSGDPASPESRIAAWNARRSALGELGRPCWDGVIHRLGRDGGVVLIPEDHGIDDPVGLVDALARATSVPVTAVRVDTTTAEIVAAVERAHELLGLTLRLGCRPGLYRFREHAMEYQLSRPARAVLGKVLEPLDNHPTDAPRHRDRDPARRSAPSRLTRPSIGHRVGGSRVCDVDQSTKAQIQRELDRAVQDDEIGAEQ
ncbi:hypothetical protein ACFWUP_15135 [Nocardia sp. NPDC058658]|uniref:hypothetical protein n=1 Tax=Nocardia sp. NPDC058658 TaxID=3346580 RepID=UPI0036668665